MNHPDRAHRKEEHIGLRITDVPSGTYRANKRSTNHYAAEVTTTTLQ
jgi:hypothetical protein